MGGHLQEVIVYATLVGVDGNVVVVKYDEDIGLGGACIVQAFPGQAAGEGTVSDDGDGLVLAALQACRFGKTKGGRYGRGGMAGTEGVIFAFSPFGETADAVPGTVIPERLLRPVRILWA